MNRYILKKARIYPKKPDWANKVYMPISMNNGLLRSENALVTIFSWIFGKTSTFEAIIGDYLHRHNIMMTNDDENDAIKVSKDIGYEIQGLLEKTMRKFPGKQLNIRPVGEFYNRSIFFKKLDYYKESYEKNILFQYEINELIKSFLERQGIIKNTISQFEHCKYYLLEELVVFEMLSEEGFLINIYPGRQLEVLKKIVTGKLPDISYALERIYLVEMKFWLNPKK